MMLLPPDAYSYFSVLLRDGQELHERAGADWARDIVDAHRTADIAELRLHCPNGWTYHLTITEPGTAFQLKCASSMAGVGHLRTAHLIGRIDDLAAGACTAYIWDMFAGRVYHHSTSFHRFTAWRVGVEDIGALSPQAQGMEARV